MATISVILVGAGGATGKPMLEELLRRKSEFARVAVLTAPNRVETFQSLDVEVIGGSLFDAQSYKGFTHVICALGNAAMILQPAVIDAAVEGGVRHFYPSEWGADLAQPEVYKVRYFREKLAVRTYLRAKAAKTPGFQYTYMVNGSFTEWSILGFDHEKNTGQVFGNPDHRLGVTSIPDIVRYTIDSLHLKFEGSERTLRVQGWAGKLSELFSALGEARNVKYQVTYLDSEKAQEKEKEAMLAGDDVTEMQFSVMSVLGSGYAVADGVAPLDNGLFDFVPETALQTFQRMFKA